MNPQKINLLLDTDKVFHDELNQLRQYPPQWMQPYDLYRSGYIEEKLVAVLITVTENNTTKARQVEIELFHMGTDVKKRDRHLSVKFMVNIEDLTKFLEGSSFGTKTSIPKSGDVTKLFRDSPYVLQQSVKIILKYLRHKKIIERASLFEKTWCAFELNKKATVSEFMKLIQALLK